MNKMNDEVPDPEKTRETRTPPPIPPTPHIPPSPADGPTRFISVTPPRQQPHPPGPPARPPAHLQPPLPPPPPPRYRPPAAHSRPPAAPPPPPRVDRRREEPAGETPWWQTINQDRPPKPLRAAAPPAPVRHAAPPAPPHQPKPTPTTASRPKAWWWVTAIAAVAVAIAGTALALSLTGTPTPTKVLDISKTQRAVEQILRDPVDGYGAGTVTGVTCNNGLDPTIKRGDEFSCDATVDGAPRRVAVVFQDDEGTYAVDRPR